MFQWNGAFFCLLVVTFHAEQGILMVRVHLRMHACIYFITNCVFVILTDPTSAIFLHHCTHEFPVGMSTLIIYDHV